jgi:ribulose-phosphate 3-epimerase
MAIICPTITAYNPHEYREQIERVAPFVERVHIDFMDGDFAPAKSPGIDHAWWPHAVKADLHIMYKQPTRYVELLVKLKPYLVIVHAESEGDFIAMANKLHEAGVKVGVALLQETPVKLIESALGVIDHVLVFSGKLGYHGGRADLGLSGKVSELKALKPSLEVGWDGGVNEHNAGYLAKSGVDVLNVGGFIQNSSDPESAYATMKQIAETPNDTKT